MGALRPIGKLTALAAAAPLPSGRSPVVDEPRSFPRSDPRGDLPRNAQVRAQKEHVLADVRAHRDLDRVHDPARAARDVVDYSRWEAPIELVMDALERTQGRPVAALREVAEIPEVRAFATATGHVGRITVGWLAGVMEHPWVLAYLRDYEIIATAAAERDGIKRLGLIAAEIMVRDARIRKTLSLRRLLENAHRAATAEDERGPLDDALRRILEGTPHDDDEEDDDADHDDGGGLGEGD